MSHRLIHLPNFLYYSLVVVITESVLVLGATIILLPTGLLNRLPLAVIGLLLAYKSIIAAIATTFMASKRWGEHLLIARGAGLILGRFVGLVLGGMLGAAIAGVVGGIVGLVLLGFLIGRAGGWISLATGNWIDRLTSPSERLASDANPELAQSSQLGVWIYGVFVPAMFVLVALFLKNYNVISKEADTRWLLTARIVAVVLSIYSILAPWILRARRELNGPPSSLQLQSAIFLTGTALSIAPALYGVVLFLAFGAPIIDVVVFALISSAATLTWSAKSQERSRAES